MQAIRDIRKQINKSLYWPCWVHTLSANLYSPMLTRAPTISFHCMSILLILAAWRVVAAVGCWPFFMVSSWSLPNPKRTPSWSHWSHSSWLSCSSVGYEDRGSIQHVQVVSMGQRMLTAWYNLSFARDHYYNYSIWGMHCHYPIWFVLNCKKLYTEIVHACMLIVLQVNCQVFYGGITKSLLRLDTYSCNLWTFRDADYKY